MLGQFETALENFERVLALQPDNAMVHYNRGVVLQKLKRPEDALASYDRAITIHPACAEAYNNRGNVLKSFHQLEDALASYDRAVALKTNYAEAHNNRGAVLQELQRLEDALTAYDRAIAVKPNYAVALMNKALLLLLTGKFEEGWRLHEWRWNAGQKGECRTFTQPLYLGDEPLSGRTLLIHAEQGFGDSLQFCRYARTAEALGAKVVLEVPSALTSVLATLPGTRTLVTQGAPLSDFDLHCPMLSLPLAFKTTLETIPADVPYLFADPHKQSDWQKRLGPKTQPKIGLAWSGKPEYINDANRTIALESLLPLLKLPFEFHSLQREYRDQDVPLLAVLPQLRNHRNELEDFSDTAALVSEMDLIISVDTSVAHLAGALGKPFWILLSYMPNYRWLMGRSDSPWYPTAKLFRQPAFGDWETVISDVAREISRKWLP
jgi:exonuclease VII small subunit